MQTSTNRKAWSQQEDQTIKNLVAIFGIEDWTQISNKLKEEYPLSKRSGKQCRERWYNHLSPIISKNPWSLEEEDKLFKLHREQGNKWKDISKEFVGRTDNDLKNHFYSTLRKSLRRLNKSLGQKNSTSQMREIKPSVLSKIMHHIYDGEAINDLLDCLKDVPSLIFQFANIKPIKSGLSFKDDQMREKVQRIFHLITQFNDQYEKGKVSRKQKVHGKKQKVQKTVRIRIQQSTQNQSFVQNDLEPSEQIGQNSIESMLDEENFEAKPDALHDNTQISMGYSSTNFPFDQYICYGRDQDNDEYNFMFAPQKSGIFDEHDQELHAQFQDPEEPSVINDYVFNQTITGRCIFHKIVEEDTYCNKFMDQLLDNVQK